MRFEAESMQELAAALFAKAKRAEEQREKERTVRGKLYLRAEANAYTDAAQLVRDTVIVPKKKCSACERLGHSCPKHFKPARD